MKRLKLISAVLLLMPVISAYSQITTEELPISIRNLENEIIESTKIIDLQTPVFGDAYEENSIMEDSSDGIQKVSVAIPVGLSIEKDGQWSSLADGGKIWQLQLRAEYAKSLDFVFSKFWLPEGGKFFIYNPTSLETIGAITSEHLLGSKSEPHRFSTGIVRGDIITLEYYQPQDEKELPIIEIEKAYYGTTTFPAFGSSASCEVNVNCSEGSNWQNEKRAVAKIYFKVGNSGYAATGFLVNRTNKDFSPLLLTANHLLTESDSGKDATGDSDLSDWVFYWDYELSSCSTTTAPAIKSTSGATLIANNPVSDFALLSLTQDPKGLSNYVPYYLGWDSSGNSGTGGVCIHHPKGDVKKISTYTCTPSSSSHSGILPSYWSLKWVATANGHGVTETGSSGAPLINSSHRVIGQLSGGSSFCGSSTGPDLYGKTSVSWTGYNISDYRRRLDHWLNPTATSLLTLDGAYPYSINGPVLISSSGVYSVRNLPSCCNVSWSVSDSYYNSHLQQDYPSANKCTVSLASGHTIYQGLLTATIYYGNTELTTVSKTISVYTGFKGTYYNGVHTRNLVLPAPIYTSIGGFMEIDSPNLIQSLVAFSGITPESYQFDSTTGHIRINFPASTEGTTTLRILTKEKVEYDIPIITTGNNYILSVEQEESQIKINVTNNDKDEETTEAQVDVVNVTSGEKVYSNNTSSTDIIGTSGWKSGVYVVRATVGEEILTEKVYVK